MKEIFTNLIVTKDIENSYTIKHEGTTRVTTIGSGVVGSFVPKLTFSAWNECNIDLTLDLNIAGVIRNNLIENADGSLSVSNSNFSFYYKPVGVVEGFNDLGGIDFKLTINKNPKINILPFTFNNTLVKAAFQPPLTSEFVSGWSDQFQDNITVTETEVKGSDGTILVCRPEAVVNSIAFYGIDKKGDWTAFGGQNYKTGKMAHLYRMKAVDSIGKMAYANWFIADSTHFNLIVDKTFIDTATYPIVIQPFGDTLGYTTNGASYQSAAADDVFSDQYTTAAKCLVSSISIGCRDSAANAKGLIYNHTGLTLLTNGVGNAVAVPTVKDWAISTYSTKPIMLTATDYLLGVIFDSAVAYLYYDANVGFNKHTDTSNSYTTPADMGSATTVADWQLSIYATYDAITTPTVAATTETNLGSTTVTANSNITSTGNADVTVRGFYYSDTDSTPDSGDSIVSETGTYGTGAYSLNISGLTAGTLYYIRAFATNSEGTSVGTVDSFTTLNIPTLTTTTVSSITVTTATSGGNITDTGGENPNKRGVCYSSVNSTPTTSDSKVEESGSFSTGSFTEPLIGLLGNTLYYTRSYAINSVGTGYGSTVKSFTTLTGPPTVTTQAATAITDITATGNGNITLTNGENSYLRGVTCKEITSNPPLPITNGTFEAGGTPPTGWTKGGTGSTTTSTTYIHSHTYSGKIVNTAGSMCYLEQYPTASTYSGRTVTFRCWVWCATADRAFLEIYDDDGSMYGTISVSEYHPGDSAWHQLTVTHPCRVSLITLAVRVAVSTGSAVTAYFDDADGEYTIESNGEFEYGNPPTNWTLEGAGASVAQSATHYAGDYSAALTRSGTDCRIYQTLDTTSAYALCPVSVTAWFYATVPNSARIKISDDGGLGNYSSYHPGDSQWHQLTAVGTCSSSYTLLRTSMYLETNDTTAYYDSVQVRYENNIIFTDILNPNFERWGSSTSCTSWSTPFPSGNAVLRTTDCVYGTYAAQFTAGDADTRFARQSNLSFTYGKTYTIYLWIKYVSGGTSVAIDFTDYQYSNWITATTSWVKYKFTLKYLGATTSGGYFDICSNTASSVIIVDGISVIESDTTEIDEAGSFGTGAFTEAITGLTASKAYTTASYAMDNYGAGYGVTVTFKATMIPTVTTQAASSITAITAIGNGNITNTGGDVPTSRGICYSHTNATPTVSESYLFEDFSIITDLSFANMGTPTTDGSIMSFTTTSDDPNFGKGGVSIDASIYTKVKIHMKIGSGGGTDAQIFWVNTEGSWSETRSQHFVIISDDAWHEYAIDLSSNAHWNVGAVTAFRLDPCTVTSISGQINYIRMDTSTGGVTFESGGFGTGAFTESLVNLNYNTLYYTRAYATNALGTGYGSVQSFSTLSGMPTVTTQAVSDVTSTSVTGNGNITDLAGTIPYTKGIAYSSGKGLALPYLTFTNPGFESGTTNWTCGSSDSSSTLAQSTDQHRSGSYSGKIVTAGTQSWMFTYQWITSTDIRTYTLSLWVWASVANTFRAQIQDSTAVLATSSYHTGDSTWQLLTVTATAAAVGWTAFGCVQNTSTATTVYIDDIAVQQSIVSNPSFELDDPPAGWTNGDPTNVTITRDATYHHDSLYSLKAVKTDASTNSWVQQNIGSNYAGKVITVSEWVWSATPNCARITTWGGAYSAHHPGDSQWHLLTVTNTIDATNQYVYPAIMDCAGTAYFDDFQVTYGDIICLPITNPSAEVDVTGWNAWQSVLSKYTNSSSESSIKVVIDTGYSDGACSWYIADVSAYRGKYLSFKMWAWCASASTAYLQVSDGVVWTNSSYHTGDSTWQLLTNESYVSPNATGLWISGLLYGAAGTTGYFDKALAILATDSNPTVIYEDGSFSTGAFTESLVNLTSGTSYKATAFAVGIGGAGSTQTVEFNTLDISDISSRFRLVVQVYKDITSRFKLKVQATKDIVSRFSFSANLYIPIASRFKMLFEKAISSRFTLWLNKEVSSRFIVWIEKNIQTRFNVWLNNDVNARLKLYAETIKDIASRFKITVSVISDVKSLFNLIAPALQDINTRFKLFVSSITSINARLNLIVPEYKDITSRFIEIVPEYYTILSRFSVLVRLFSDALSRFNIVAEAFQDIGTRFGFLFNSDVNARLKLKATVYRNIKLKFRAFISKEVFSRVYIIAPTYFDILSRIVIIAEDNQDIQSRLRLVVRDIDNVYSRYILWLESDITLHFKIIETSYQYIYSRMIVFVNIIKDISSKFICSKREYLYILLRYKMFISAYTYLKCRFNLKVPAYNFVLLHFKLAIEKDIHLLFKVFIHLVKDISSRFILWFENNVNSKFIIYIEKNVKLRFKLWFERSISFRFKEIVQALSYIATRYKVFIDKFIHTTFIINVVTTVNSRFALIVSAFKNILLSFKVFVQEYKLILLRFNIFVQVYKYITFIFRIIVLSQFVLFTRFEMFIFNIRDAISRCIIRVYTNKDAKCRYYLVISASPQNLELLFIQDLHRIKQVDDC